MPDYFYDMDLVVDPLNPSNVVANGSVAIYDPADTAGTTLLALKDPSGLPLPNPLTSNANGFLPPRIAQVPQTLWKSGGFDGYFNSFKGLRDEAVSAVAAAQGAADAATTAVAEVVTTAAVDSAGALVLTKASGATVNAGNVRGPQGVQGPAGLNGSNVLPTDTAIQQAITTPGTATATALTATIATQTAPKLDSAKAAVTYAPKIQPGSDLVRSMVGAAVMSSLPTLTASSTAPAAFTRTLRVEASLANFWSGFRVSGAPMMVVSAPGAHPRGATKTTPAANTWGGCARLEFDMEDDGFAFTMQATAGARFKIWVNERPHAAAMQLVSSVSGVSGTGTHHVTVDFGSRAYRRIVFEWAADSSAPSNFQGLRVKPTAAIFPPSIPSPRFMVIHDSYGYGVGATDVGDSYAIQLGRLLGFADIWNFTAVPSTGVLKTDAPNLYGRYSSRFSTDVLPYLRAGDVCLYSGSVNDGAEAAGAVQMQAIADLTALMTAKPDTRFIVASPIYTTVPLASHTRLRDEMAAAAAAVGLPFVNLMDTALGLWTGTGTVDAPAGDGNSDFYSKNVGGFHPTTAGALAIAREEARQVAAALGQAR